MSRRLLVYAAYGLLVAASLTLAVREPLLFQKLNTLRKTDRIPDLVVPPEEGPIDIEALIRPIPLHGRAVMSVDPETRFRRTVIEGGGNCSQICFGLAWDLDRKGIDYQIIHMIKPDGLATGDGHTVMRLYYRIGQTVRVGLVDVSFGVLLTGAKGGLDVEDVEAAPVEGWSYVSLNPNAHSPSYHDDFLVDAVIGYIPKTEVEAYYAFLERVYFPLGSELLEKYVFDGLALAFGALPEVYVPKYEEVAACWPVRLPLHRGALWVLRSAFVVLPLIGWLEIRRAARRR